MGANGRPHLESPITACVARWRQEAEALRRRGVQELPEIYESFVNDIEAALREWELEALLVRDAAKEGGKSMSQIRRDVQSGQLANVSQAGPIRIQRRDVLGLQSVRPS